ncbi:MAG: TATA-box-binding protein [Candidatus Anstonellales archaeon]
MSGIRIPKPKFKIENIVASANLNIELDLYSIAFKIPGVEYEPEQFPGAILKLKEPKSSLLLFKNGKIICTGCQSESQVQTTVNRTMNLLKPYAKTTPQTHAKPKFKIENIVASASLGVYLDLYSIAAEVEDVEYEPEQFPGAILKFKNPKSSLLLFKNGKIICTGCQSENDVRKTLLHLTRVLKNYASKPPSK